MFFFPQRNPVSLPVPTAVDLSGNRAYVQLRGAPATGQTMVSNVTKAPQSQQIDYPRVTAKLREALDKQIAKRGKHQSIVSYHGLRIRGWYSQRHHHDRRVASSCIRSIVRPSHPWTGHRGALNSTRQRFTLFSTAFTTTPIRTT
eukprot:2596504-Pleurochrysis_carterae.AAC.1